MLGLYPVCVTRFGPYHLNSTFSVYWMQLNFYSLDATYQLGAGVFVSVTSQSSVETDERIGRESTDGCYRRLILDR